MKVPLPPEGDCQIQVGMSLYCPDCSTSFHSCCPWLSVTRCRVISLCKPCFTVFLPLHSLYKRKTPPFRREQKHLRKCSGVKQRLMDDVVVIIGTCDPPCSQCVPFLPARSLINNLFLESLCFVVALLRCNYLYVSHLLYTVWFNSNRSNNSSYGLLTNLEQVTFRI